MSKDEDLGKEGKQGMLATVELGADFSRGCAGREISLLLFATHSHPGIRELTLVHTSGQGVNHRS